MDWFIDGVLVVLVCLIIVVFVVLILLVSVFVEGILRLFDNNK